MEDDGGLIHQLRSRVIILLPLPFAIPRVLLATRTAACPLFRVLVRPAVAKRFRERVKLHYPSSVQKGRLQGDDENILV